MSDQASRLRRAVDPATSSVPAASPAASPATADEAAEPQPRGPLSIRPSGGAATVPLEDVPAEAASKPVVPRTAAIVRPATIGPADRPAGVAPDARSIAPSTPMRPRPVSVGAPRPSVVGPSRGPVPAGGAPMSARVESVPPTPERVAPVLARTIAIASGKGGVGKTSLTVSLASAIAGAGRSVLLVDGDLGLGNADVACGVVARATLADVLSARRSFEAAVTPVEPGFGLVAAGSGLAGLAAAPAEARRDLVAALAPAELGRDALLVDCGAGVGPVVLALAAAADRTLVVAVPERASIVDAYGLIKCLARQGMDRPIGLVVNQVRRRSEAAEVHRRLAAVARDRLGVTIRLEAVVPYDDAVRHAAAAGRPVVRHAPKSPSARAIEGLAERLLASTSPSAGASAADGAGFGTRLAQWLGRR